MKLRNIIIGIVLTILILVGSTKTFAQSKQPTSPETKAKMLQLIDTMEKDPFNKGFKNQYKEVLVWLVDAPDVSVALCSDVMGNIKQFKGDEGGALVGFLAFSEARFILQHPEQSSDKLAVNVAGVEGIINMYKSMKTSKPKLKIEPMDKLLELQSNGKLTSFIQDALKNCK